VPIPAKKKLDKKVAFSLAECLEAFRDEERLSGFDTVYCRRCKEHREVTKKLELYRLPQIMIIHLKRFTAKNIQTRKNKVNLMGGE